VPALHRAEGNQIGGGAARGRDAGRGATAGAGVGEADQIALLLAATACATACAIACAGARAARGRFGAGRNGLGGRLRPAIAALAAVERRAGDVAQQAVHPRCAVPPVAPGPPLGLLRRGRDPAAVRAVEAAPAVEQQLHHPLHLHPVPGIPGGERAALHQGPQVRLPQLDADHEARFALRGRANAAPTRDRSICGLPLARLVARRCGGSRCTRRGDTEALQRFRQPLRGQAQAVQPLDQRAGTAARVAQRLFEKGDLAAQQRQQRAQPGDHVRFEQRSVVRRPVATRSAATRRSVAAHAHLPMHRARPIHCRAGSTILLDLKLCCERQMLVMPA